MNTQRKAKITRISIDLIPHDEQFPWHQISVWVHRSNKHMQCYYWTDCPDHQPRINSKTRFARLAILTEGACRVCPV